MKTNDDKPEIIRPVINMNGMTAAQHVRMRCEARTAVKACLKAVNELRPSGRDYIGDDAALKRDTAIHESRVRFLDGLYNALMEEAVEIQEDGR